MVAIKRRKRLLAEEKQQGVEARKVARVEKQDAEAEARAQLAAAFEKCGAGCVCGADPCPVAGLKRCVTCGDIKKRVCGKQVCKAARDAAAPKALPAPSPAAEIVEQPYEESEVY